MQYPSFFRKILSSGLILSGAAYATEVPLNNAGFESGTAGWDAPVFKPEGDGGISQEQVHSGDHSYRLRAGKGSQAFMPMETKSVVPGRYYHLSVWAKAANAGQETVRSGLKLEWYNSLDKNQTGVSTSKNLKPGGEWTQLHCVSKAGEDTEKVLMLIRVFNEGEVYFDDMRLEEAKVTLTDTRGYIHAYGEPISVDVKVWISEPPTNNTSPELVLDATGPDGKVITPKVTVTSVEGEPGHYVVSGTLPPINDGFYTLNISYGEHQSLVSARTQLGHKDRKPSRLDATGNILFQGKPFFPIGMYHPQDYPAYKNGATSDTPEDAEANYALLAQNGFNAVQGDSYPDLERFGKYLDQAHKYGLAVDVPFYHNGQIKANLTDSLQKIARYKDHPAVLNWKIIDEPNIRPEVSEQVPDAYYQLKKADKDTPIELTMAVTEALESWFHYADIIQIDKYPVPDEKITDVGLYTRLAVKHKLPWQNFSFVVQCGWNGLQSQPTIDQARCMVYQALIEGAKGIWWYSMYDPGWDLTKTPLWPKMKAINEEIKKLSEPLMLGEHLVDIAPSNDKVIARAIKYEGKIYLLVTNPEGSDQNVEIALAGVKASGLTLNGEKVTLEDNKLRASMKSLDSQTYIFDVL